MTFEWDPEKDRLNQEKHGVSFFTAQYAFMDTNRVIAVDHRHSTLQETRYFCFGKVEDRILTVRFTYRENSVRIIGAGFWREGRKKYENKKRLP